MTATYTQYNPGIKEIQFFLAANVASIASCDAHSEYLFFVCEMAYDGLAYTSWAVQSMSIFSQYGWKDLGTGHVVHVHGPRHAVHQVYIENRQGINDRTYQARLSFDDGRHEEISLSRDQFGAVYTLKDTHVTRSVHYDIIDASGNPGNPGISEISFLVLHPVASIASCEAHNWHVYDCAHTYDENLNTEWAVINGGTGGWTNPDYGDITFRVRTNHRRPPSVSSTSA